MKIKEISEKLHITPRAIRYYEEKGLISPNKDHRNHYRTYTEPDARRLQSIISLREIGIPVDDIKKMLDELDDGDKDELLYSLELQRSVMFAELIELKNSIKMTDDMIDSLKKNSSLDWDNTFELTKGLKALRETRASWRDHWNFDRQAYFHDQLVLGGQGEFNKHPNYHQALETVVEWIKPDLNEIGLDIGTGTGNLAGVFLEKGIQMAGIDQSVEMLKQSQKKFPQLETKLGNFLAIPYLDNHFDFVVTSYALHHLTDEQKKLALNEMQRVLKPHGRICIADLMFENVEVKKQYVNQLKMNGKQDIVHEIESEYYADRSKLIDWFDQNGYITKVRQWNELLHLVLAVPIKHMY